MAQESAQVFAAGAPPPAAIPAHVPPALVFDITRYFEPTAEADPFHASANIHQELPPVFYSASRGLAQGSDGWFVTHYEDIREVYQNDRYYSTHEPGELPAAGRRDSISTTARPRTRRSPTSTTWSPTGKAAAPSR